MNIVLTLLLAVCLFVSGTASMLPKSYAAATIAVYQVGDDVTATLYSNGCLSLSGSGETYDYNPGVTVAPFLMEAASPSLRWKSADRLQKSAIICFIIAVILRAR